MLGDSYDVVINFVKGCASYTTYLANRKLNVNKNQSLKFEPVELSYWNY